MLKLPHEVFMKSTTEVDLVKLFWCKFTGFTHSFCKLDLFTTLVQILFTQKIIRSTQSNVKQYSLVDLKSSISFIRYKDWSLVWGCYDINALGQGKLIRINQLPVSVTRWQHGSQIYFVTFIRWKIAYVLITQQTQKLEKK